MDNKNEEAMREGVLNSRCVIAIITEGPTKKENYFERKYCLQELRWALESNVKIQPVVRVQDKNAIGKLLDGAPDDLKGLGKIDFIDLNRGDADYFEAGVTKLAKSLEQPNARYRWRTGGACACGPQQGRVELCLSHGTVPPAVHDQIALGSFPFRRTESRVSHPASQAQGHTVSLFFRQRT